MKDRRFTVKQEVRPRLALGYRKPTLPHRADYVFDLIDQLLGDGRSSRLYRHLVVEKKIAVGVTTYQGFPGTRASNLFLIQVTPVGDLNKTLQEVDQLLEQFIREGPTEKEVQKGVNRLQAQRVWRLKTNAGLADELAFFEQAAGTWHYLRDYPEIISTVTPKEIREVAGEYLRPENRIVGEMGR